MDSRGRLTVVVVVALALAACTAARPGVGGNDIDKPAKTSNHVIGKEVSSKESKVEPQASKSNGDTVIEEIKQASEGSVATNDTIEKVDDEKERNEQKSENSTLKSVNERFPSAVLFGGTCGGSIISPKWILTAGHCTLFTGGRYVLAGTGNSWDDSGVTRHVKRLVVHPLFSVGPYWLDADQYNIRQVAARWDFMLAELDEPLPLDGKTMAAVELNEVTELPEGLEVGYGGYGAEHHGDTMRSEMHGMELQVMPDSACKEALEQYEAEDMLCTKGRPPRFDSACNGDSGSGLVSNGKLYGVASWVQDDAHRCFNGALVVFSRVSSVRDWIRQVTKI